MGPTSFNVGDSRTPAASVNSRPLQWGRRLSTSETPTYPPYRGGVRSGFNGADVFQRRRPASLATCSMVFSSASMGPTSFNVGDGNRINFTDGGNKASMGPTSFNVGDILGEYSFFILYCASMGPTSFNVGDEGTTQETIKAICASMGPTSFNVGDKYATIVQCYVFGLQWGRRLSTSETNRTSTGA